MSRDSCLLKLYVGLYSTLLATMSDYVNIAEHGRENGEKERQFLKNVIGIYQVAIPGVSFQYGDKTNQDELDFDNLQSIKFGSIEITREELQRIFSEEFSDELEEYLTETYAFNSKFLKSLPSFVCAIGCVEHTGEVMQMLADDMKKHSADYADIYKFIARRFKYCAVALKGIK